MTERHPDKIGFAMNGTIGNGSVLFITNADYFKEFAKIETKVTAKEAQTRSPLINNFGFFFENGEKAFKSRRIFHEVFSVEKLGSFVPIISDILDQEFELFKRNNMPNGETKTIDFRELIKKPLYKITHVFVFGDKKYKYFEGALLFEQVSDAFYLFTGIVRNKLNFITMGLIEKLGLLFPMNKLENLYGRISKELIKLYNISD